MRRSLLVALLSIAMLFRTADAAVPLRLELIGVEEQPGKVIATVGAFDTNAKPIAALTTSDFRASLNLVPLTVTGVETAKTRLPASIVLLVDTSGSMAGNPLLQAKQAMADFLQTLDANDQVAVVSFDNSVSLIQDFTTDRTALTGAVNRLNAVGNTALFDAVIDASSRVAAQGTGGRKMVVLLSDGESTLSLEKRAASIQAAKASGASFVPVGFGTAIDRPYLNDLANGTGGRLFEAVTTAQLRTAYSDLAAAIRNQYTLTMTIPATFDRRPPARLIVTLVYRGLTASADRQLDAAPNAVSPPFPMSLGGLPAGTRLAESVAVQPSADAQITRVDYSVDGTVIQTVVEAPFAFSLDPSQFVPGSHTLKAVATGADGRTGEAQTPFIVPVPATGSGGMSISPVVLLLLPLLAIVGGLGWVVYKRQRNAPSDVVHRVKPFAVRNVAEPTGPVEGWPEPLPADEVVTATVIGRVVLLNEEAIRSGELEGIQEFDIGSSPLTLGTGDSCDITLVDPEGRIAAEEARLWVQKGRLVYHKLTTLSAMATEGVTSGWQILDSGEEFQVGPYRILYQADVAAEPEAAPVEKETPPDWAEPARFGEMWSPRPEDPRISA